jgi:hypothetical protein
MVFYKQLNASTIRQQFSLQPVEALSSTENFLKVPQSGTFKKFSGFYNSAKPKIGFHDENLLRNNRCVAKQHIYYF